MTATIAELEAAVAAPDGVLRLPALVAGRLVLAPEPPAAAIPAGPGRFRFPGGYGLRRPLLDRAGAPTGELRTVVVPAIPPARLSARDPALMEELARLPFGEVLAYVGGMREALAPSTAIAAGLAAASGGRRARVAVELMRALLDPDGLAEAVDRDLGAPGVAGRRFLDGWVPARTRRHSGVTSRAGRELLGLAPSAVAAPALRALPTRQLHVTAGNADAIPLVSLLRALATKGQAIVKSPSESFLAGTLLAVTMHELDPSHPLTRATSLVSWPGGDRAVEDALLGGGGFDRLVAWGSADTIASLGARAGGLRSLLLGPRMGVSLIGRGAPAAAAELAVSDSLIEDQAACSSSLVHYVEGDEADALAYCETARAALARWDALVPHVPSPAAAGRLERLRRGELAGARWWANRRGAATTSAVAYARVPFDLAAHPGGRCVVVRRVDDLGEAVALLHPGIATAGVAPEPRRLALRDAIAARGVSLVAPLGEAESTYAGMPHDGARILSELVAWTSA
jgi:hypothetical protein